MFNIFNTYYKERLNGGTVPPDKKHPGGTVSADKTYPGVTVPTDKTHPGGTVHPDKTHPGRTVPPDKTHPGGTVPPDKIPQFYFHIILFQMKKRGNFGPGPKGLRLFGIGTF